MLAQYLRLAPYGNGSHGIAHAARCYFDRPAGDLTWAQIALLAAIPQAPALMDPAAMGAAARAAGGRAQLAMPGPAGRAAGAELPERARAELAAITVGRRQGGRRRCRRCCGCTIWCAMPARRMIRPTPRCGHRWICGAAAVAKRRRRDLARGGGAGRSRRR